MKCPHCPRTFHRKDHVTQHLRQYHRVSNDTNERLVVLCMHQEHTLPSLDLVSLHGSLTPRCGQAFASNAELQKHIRKVHKETPFQCPVYGCSRVGADGCVSKHARATHQRKEHAGMDEVSLEAMNHEVDVLMPEYLPRK